MDFITFRDLKGNKILQKGEYEWRPPFCKKYNKVGHECEVEPKHKQVDQVKQVWTVKQNIEESNKETAKITQENETKIKET